MTAAEHQREAEAWQVIARCCERVYLEAPVHLFWKAIHRWQWAAAHCRLHRTAAAESTPQKEAA